MVSQTKLSLLCLAASALTGHERSVERHVLLRHQYFDPHEA